MDGLNYQFAKQYISETNHEVIVGDKPILFGPYDRRYSIIRPNLLVHLGEVMREDVVLKKISTLDDIEKEFRFTVASRKVKRPWYKFQQREVYLTRFTSNIEVPNRLSQLRSGYFVEYDPLRKRIRLVGKNAGPNGKGGWVDVFQKKEYSKKLSFKMDDYVKDPNAVIDEVWQHWMPSEEEKRIYNLVDEIPVMITEEGNLLTIPRYDVQGKEDMYVIGLVGKRGSGKTFGMNSLCGRIKWIFGDNIIIANDPLNQLNEWALPNLDKQQAYELSKFNERPLPLPILPLYPVVGSFNLKDIEYGYPVSLSFSDFMNGWRNYKVGFKQMDLSLDRSEKWFLQLRDKLEQCGSIEGMKDIVSQEYNGIKGLEGSVDKIKTVLDNLNELNFMDVSNNVPSTWIIDGEESMPVLGLADIGVIPLLETNSLFGPYKSLYPLYIRFVLDKIFEHQSKTKNRTWILMDEIGYFYKDMDNRATVATGVTNRLFTQGRPAMIGTIFTIQNYSMLDQQSRNNINYLFTFIYTSNEEINAIAKDFGLMAHWKDELRHLRTHECLAISNDKPFKVYSHDQEPYYTTGVFRGFMLPPLSQHKQPSKR